MQGLQIPPATEGTNSNRPQLMNRPLTQDVGNSLLSSLWATALPDVPDHSETFIMAPLHHLQRSQAQSYSTLQLEADQAKGQDGSLPGACISLHFWEEGPNQTYTQCLLWFGQKTSN